MDDFSMILRPVEGVHTRSSEASAVVLADGRILLAYTDFYGGRPIGGEDDDPACISAIVSEDGGRAWGEPYTLQPNDGGLNVMSVAMLRLQSGKIAFFCCRKNRQDLADITAGDCAVYMRTSDDEAATWSEETRVNPSRGYLFIVNDSVTQLRCGRVLVPTGPNWCTYSDDEGRTWTSSSPVTRQFFEPMPVELADGRVLMILRGEPMHRAFSSDQGESWTEAEPMPGITTTDHAPANVKRIPATGDLLLVWNRNRGRQRCPLSTAVSRDEGETWEHVRDLESDVAAGGEWGYAYSSVTFNGNEVLLTYWVNAGALKLRILPLGWLYEG